MQQYDLTYADNPNYLDPSATSVASPLAVLRDDPNVRPVWAIVAEPYDPDAAALTTVRLAGEGFTTSAGDTPPGVTFTGGVNRPYSIVNQIVGSGDLSPASTPEPGIIEAENYDRSLDYLTDLDWGGRTISVYVGLREFISDPNDTDFASFAQVFSGTAEDIEWREHFVTILLRDSRYKLDVPIQTTTYAGTGGLEGDDSIKGRQKPKMFGQVRQFEPVLIDPANLLYQFHDGSAQAVNAVRDKGGALSFTADFANSTLLLASSPASGFYNTCLAESMFMLGASPAGAVTGDFQGDNSGSLGYVSTVAGIVRKLVQDSADLSDSELEIGTFDDLDASNSAVAGFVCSLDEVSVEEAVNQLIRSVGGFYTFTRVGKLKVGLYTDPASGTPVATFAESDFYPEKDGGKWLRSHFARPAHTVKVKYKRYWKTLSPNDVVGSVSEADRADFGKDYRVATPAEDAAVLGRFPLAQVRDFNTLLDASADAATEATRQLALFKENRDVYDARLRTGLFQYDLGDVIKVQTVAAIYGLDAGRNFLVVGYSEDAGTADQDMEVALYLWG